MYMIKSCIYLFRICFNYVCRDKPTIHKINKFDLCWVKFTITAKIFGTGVGIEGSRRGQGKTNDEVCYDIVMQIKHHPYMQE